MGLSVFIVSITIALVAITFFVTKDSKQEV